MQPNQQLPAQPTPLPYTASVNTVAPPITSADIISVGDKRFALPPTVNATWQTALVVIDTNNELIAQFPDGAQYFASQVQWGGKVADEPVPTIEQPAASLLRPGYQAFLEEITKLERASQEIFHLPLIGVLTMVRRLAHINNLDATGKMDNYLGEQVFVADPDTFASWVQAYLEELQRREAEADAGKTAE